MRLRRPDRRHLLAAVAMLAAPGAQARRLRPAPQVQINLAGQAPALTSPAGQAAVIPAGADAASRMTTQVRLNGEGPYEFVVDTGANRSVVASEAAATLRLPVGPQTPVHGIAGVEPAGTVEVASLAVGEVRSSGLELPILPGGQLGAQGLLGVDVMRDRRVTLDFAAGVLVITPPRHEVDTPGLEAPTRILGAHRDVISVAARYRFGQLTIVDADVDGVPVTAFLDSGSQNTVANLALRNALVGRRPGLTAQMHPVELLSATGQSARGEVCVLPEIRLGGLAIGDLGAVFADLHTFAIWRLIDRPAILIGVDVLRHFKAVELDFSRRRVVFYAPRSATTVYGG
ncbi:retroviral-like aspartic protease family protein [Caulobacter sp. KR2-114]|uniref:retroviral-like aspartic protease family protein n=1 Tax=Caulobacter sp. KR2-114 TaxID=3400912 RepID=UPI003C11517C